MTPKINEKSILSVVLRQDGFKEVSSWANMAQEAPTHPRRCSLILHHFVIDFEVDFLSGCMGAHTF